MDIAIKSFDGFDLDNATYKAWFPAGEAALARESDPIVLPVIGGFPRNEGFNHKSSSFQIGIAVEGPLAAGVKALKQQFRVGRTGELIIEVESEQTARTCSVAAVYPFAEAANFVVVALIASDPRWHALLDTVTSEDVDTDGQTWDVVNAGNASDERAVIRITPTDQKPAANAWQKRRQVVLANVAPTALGDYPIDVTDGGLNHAAMVTAVHSQAGGDDLRVLVDGVEEPRYFGEHTSTDPNSTTTKIWATPEQGPGLEADLYAAITSSVPADGGELEVEAGTIGDFPRQGALVNLNSGEVIRYSGWTERNDNGRAAFTGIKRGQRGTTAATGSAGDPLMLAERKVEIISGHLGIGAPEARPDKKPLLNLASSTLTNLRWEWVQFYDGLYPGRPGGWTIKLQGRDSQAGFIYVPESASGPANDVDFAYVYRSEPVGKRNANTMWRAFPTGTKGTSGQVSFTRTVDGTLVAKLLGILEDGLEVTLATLRGPLTSGTYTSAWTSKVRALGLYVASQVVVSTPEIDDATLLDGALGSGVASDQIHNTNALGGNIEQVVANEADEPMIVRAIQALIYQPDANAGFINMQVFPDDGSGGIGSTFFVNRTFVPAAPNPGWVTISGFNPFPIMPGGKIHMKPNNLADSTISQTRWSYSPVAAFDVWPFHALRLLGDGPIVDYARAEGGTDSGVAPDNATFDGFGVDLDTALTPYIDMRAEEDCYWLNGELVNNTTGQRIALDMVIGLTDEIEIDCATQTARNVTTAEDVSYGVSFPDGAFVMAAGTNQLQRDSAGIAGETIEITHRARWE